MEHTLVAVFEQRRAAEQALADLLACGYTRQMARLADQEAPGPEVAGARGSSFGASLKHLFADIFGKDRSPDAHRYSEAVARGHCVLTVMTGSEAEAERAADIVARYGPVDLDEQGQSWRGAAGAAYAAAPGVSQQSGQGAGMQGGQDPGAQQRAIPVIEEELKIGKRDVQRGGVRIYQRVVATPVHETVGLREEHVTVERHAVDRPPTPADLNAFQETTIELRETAEEAVVEKHARVVEEVVVGKEVRQRQEQISETVRHTEVEVEQLTPDEEAYFRGHWSSHYGPAYGNYQDYAPAYSYGSSMARSQTYHGRPWDAVESTLRSDWETRYPASAWEKMKAAIRHGWERIRS